MIKYNLRTISQIIDEIDIFFENPEKQVLYVGGIVGTELFKYVALTSTKHINLNRILFIEGCQDYIGLSTTKLQNHIFYPSILKETNPNSPFGYDPFKEKWYPDKEYHTEIDLDKLSGYSLLIINDGHLIDKVLIDDLKKMFSGKIIVITDPFDVGGMIYARYPTVVESFTKLPTIQAYARHVYGFDSFMIDKHKSSLNEIKMQNRSIGKIDDKQYISNDPNMISSIREKQYKTSFRKNQKVIVTSKSGRKLYTSFSKTNVVLYNNSLMTIESSQINPWMTLRLYNSKDYVKCSLTYDKNPDDVNVNVSPANILTLDQYAHHKFKNTVFVYNKDYDLSIEYKYSILKNTNNLQLVMR